MSQENVEFVRRLFEEFQAGMERGDPAPSDPKFFADDWEWILPTPLDGKSVWRGQEGFAEFMRTWTEQFEDWSTEVERWIEVGDDRVVALTHQSGTGKGSGVPVELNLGLVYELQDGRLVRVRNYLSHAEALAAAGLKE